jgi:glutamine amidotransferase
MVVIINYGLGNVASIANIIKKVGGTSEISDHPDAVRKAKSLIIPGVGSFDHGISELHRRGLFSAIQDAAQNDIPILGICLGMQLLGNNSEEGKFKGLSLIDADFVKFKFEDKSQLRIPHVGWNNVTTLLDNPLIPLDNEERRFYFTHSYHAVCNKPSEGMLSTNYGYSFTSAFSSGRIFGVQFHPEKSHRFGIDLIRRFIVL